MADLPLVQYYQPFEKLRRDLPGIRLCMRSMLMNILAEIAVLNILHRDMHGIRVFEPAEEYCKQRRMLIASATGNHV